MKKQYTKTFSCRNCGVVIEKTFDFGVLARNIGICDNCGIDNGDDFVSIGLKDNFNALTPETIADNKLIEPVK